MPRPRTMTADGDVRTRIIAAAVELFAERSFEGTPVQDIVERAGVTKGAMYHYFKAKDDLLFEIYSAVYREQFASLERILAKEADPVSTLRAVIEDVVTTTATYIREARVFARDSWRIDAARWHELQADWRRYQDSVRAVIRDGQESDEFSTTASPEVVSWSIFGLTNSMPTWFRADGPKPAATIASELADLILAGMRPTTTEGKPQS